MRALYGMTTVSPAERKTIERVRRVAADVPAEEAGAAIETLARAVIAHGWTILPLHSPSLGTDEIAILGWLARYQRNRASFLDVLPVELEEVFLDGAMALDAAGARLSHLASQRLATIEAAMPMTRPSVARRPIEAEAPSAGLRAALTTLAAHKPVMTARHLRRLGLGFQKVNGLCRAGILVRTGVGHYRLA